MIVTPSTTARTSSLRFNALEGRHRLDDGLRWHSLPGRKGSGRRGVQRIMFPRHRQAIAQQTANPREPSVQRVRGPSWRSFGHSPMGARSKSITLDRTKSLGNTFANVLAAIEGHNTPTPRNKVDQPLEGRLHRRKVRIDISMIELDMGQNQRHRESSEETSAPCQRRPYRTRRLQAETAESAAP